MFAFNWWGRLEFGCKFNLESRQSITLSHSSDRYIFWLHSLPFRFFPASFQLLLRFISASSQHVLLVKTVARWAGKFRIKFIKLLLSSQLTPVVPNKPLRRKMMNHLVWWSSLTTCNLLFHVFAYPGISSHPGGALLATLRGFSPMIHQYRSQRLASEPLVSALPIAILKALDADTRIGWPHRCAMCVHRCTVWSPHRTAYKFI